MKSVTIIYGSSTGNTQRAAQSIKSHLNGFDVTILDVGPVLIGSNVLIATNAQLYTATHDMAFMARRSWQVYGKAITIGDDVWVGGGAIICPGVTVGARSIIGAGAVVTRDVPEDVLVVGNPARIVRSLKAND